MNNEKAVVVCLPVDGHDSRPSNVSTGVCSKCGVAVFLAPSTMRLLKSDVTIAVLCVRCIPPSAQVIRPLRLVATAEELEEELRAYILYSQRN